MNKLFFIVLITLLTQFSSFSDCPSTKQISVDFEKINHNSNNQSSLIKLKQVSELCKYQDSTYTKILQRIVENYILELDYGPANSLIQIAIRFNSLEHKNINPIYLVDNYVTFAKILNLQGDYQRALRIYEKTISLSMNYQQTKKLIPKLYSQKANILYKMGDFEQAIF